MAPGAQPGRYAVRQVAPDLKDDFFRVHSPGCQADWCFCVAWWVPTWEGWGQRTAQENRVLREALFQQGHYDGYLLYLEGAPVGWCQSGPRDRLDKLCRAYGFPRDPQIWALTCFLLAPALRGQGHMHHFLAAILEDLARGGAQHVQAFPRTGQDLPAGEAWTGTEALFRQAGFTLEQDHPHRPVYGMRLAQGTSPFVQSDTSPFG